ncbi:MAG: T9SS type A sorting domain-containing protein, partial [Flavobacteriales bacterium]|nr:T9SS type A sorting domain-containing protein [Flavobacteriales bacterium]
TYTVTGTDANGCSSTSTVTVTVDSQITASAGSDVSICNGDNTTLNASGGTNYSWSPSTGLSDPNIANPVASPTSTTTYTVTASSGQCTSTASVTVTVNNLPAAPVVSQSGNDLASTAAVSYQWYLNGSPIAGATSQTFTPVVNGDYTVEITDANGCSMMSATPFTFSGIGAGILEEVNSNYIHIYPNPSSGIFTLEVNAPWDGNHKVEIVNAVGQVVYSTSLTLVSGQNAKTDVHLPAIAPGMYSVKISNNDHSAVKRIVKM